MVYSLDFLPYHFLLTSIGEGGELKYLDVSTGQTPANHRTRRGPCDVMRHNPTNGVVHLGHSRGTVTLWTPNIGTPVVDMFCHHGSITALDVFDNYMVTAGMDGCWKIWDLRKYKEVHKFNYFGTPPSTIATSQTGLVSIGFGSHVQIWKDLHKQKPPAPYVDHRLHGGNHVSSLRFRPFEDVCCIGSSSGVSTIIVPGSGLSNIDSLHVNPYETPKQRRERLVHQLLEKLQPETITLKRSVVGTVDTAPASVIALEKKLEEEAAVTPSREKNKKRGRSTPAAKQKVKRLQYKQIVQEKARERLRNASLNNRGHKLPTDDSALDESELSPA